MEIVQKLHRSPKIIVSNRDPIFTGHFWMELFSCLGTQLAHSSLYHPQSDEQTEIVNKFLEGYLRCFVSDKQTQWFKWLPLEEWWYNTSFHTETKMKPFMVLYGYHPPSIMLAHEMVRCICCQLTRKVHSILMSTSCNYPSLLQLRNVSRGVFWFSTPSFN
jgi:hypothetical protein